VKGSESRDGIVAVWSVKLQNSTELIPPTNNISDPLTSSRSSQPAELQHHNQDVPTSINRPPFIPAV
jgi:hypothetical protein